MTNSDKSKIIAVTTETPCGDFCMLIQDDGTDRVVASGFDTQKTLLNRVGLNDSEGRTVVDMSHHSYVGYVQSYFSGDCHALKHIKISYGGTKFQEKIWRALSRVKVGNITTYKGLAEKVGSPRAVRAVGSACAANPLILLVPCHRVVRSDGGVGEYVYGAKIKNWLITHESRK